VEGKAPADFNATMAVWWRHFNFEEPAIYGQGKGIPNGGVNLLPLVSKAVDAIKDAKRNREAERPARPRTRPRRLRPDRARRRRPSASPAP
jgi:hypothetical protein